jgi:hypothetical protein
MAEALFEGKSSTKKPVAKEGFQIGFCLLCRWPIMGRSGHMHTREEKCYGGLQHDCMMCGSEVFGAKSYVCSRRCFHDWGCELDGEGKEVYKTGREFIADMAESKDERDRKDAFETLAFMIEESLCDEADELFDKYFTRHGCGSSYDCERLVWKNGDHCARCMANNEALVRAVFMRRQVTAERKKASTPKQQKQAPVTATPVVVTIKVNDAEFPALPKAPVKKAATVPPKSWAEVSKKAAGSKAVQNCWAARCRK